MGKNKGTNQEWSIESGCVTEEAARNRKISAIIQFLEQAKRNLLMERNEEGCVWV